MPSRTIHCKIIHCKNTIKKRISPVLSELGILSYAKMPMALVKTEEDTQSTIDTTESHEGQ